MTVAEKLYSLSVLELERVRNEKEEGMRWSLWNSLRGMKLEEEVRRPVCELAGVSELATGCLTRGGDCAMADGYQRARRLRGLARATCVQERCKTSPDRRVGATCSLPLPLASAHSATKDDQETIIE